MRVVSSPIYLAILILLIRMVVAVPVPHLTDEERQDHLVQYVRLHMEAQRHEAESYRHAELEKVTSGLQKDTHEEEKKRYTNLAHAAEIQAEYHHAQLNSSPPSSPSQSSSGSSDGDPFQYVEYLRSRTPPLPASNGASRAAR